MSSNSYKMMNDARRADEDAAREVEKLRAIASIGKFVLAARKQRAAMAEGGWGHAIWCNMTDPDSPRCNCGIADMQAALREYEVCRAEDEPSAE